MCARVCARALARPYFGQKEMILEKWGFFCEQQKEKRAAE